MHMPDYLFAYGTLQPGLAPKGIAETAAKLRPIGKGFVCGDIIQLDDYPGAVPDPDSNNKIIGTVLELPADESVLSQLDEYEGYDPDAAEASEFVRIKQIVQLSDGGKLECWMYRYNRPPHV